MKQFILAIALSTVVVGSVNAQGASHDTVSTYQIDYIAPAKYSHSQFGMGVQVASTTSLLFSWQSAESNPYGRSWRLEPSIAFSSSDYETEGFHSVSASLSIGLGYYWRWRVRAPFDNLFFTMGPRATVTGTTGSITNQTETFIDSTSLKLTTVSTTTSHFTTTLSLLAGPEYAVDAWSQHFTIGGFFSFGATITGRIKYSPSGQLSPWTLSTGTGTGIILRYYFM